jgi:hypothetical protein
VKTSPQTGRMAKSKICHVLMPYRNISNMLMKKKGMKKWKQEKITLKSLKESMDKMHIVEKKERKEKKANYNQ